MGKAQRLSIIDGDEAGAEQQTAPGCIYLSVSIYIMASKVSVLLKPLSPHLPQSRVTLDLLQADGTTYVCIGWDYMVQLACPDPQSLYLPLPRTPLPTKRTP